ncbi:unnamed protein product [Soboliphyme baturini]|uniref:Uncharacterized protein n=1 Tax=Soboliphyme baturini TaxID=241478 RepID=A0A183I9I4_9BILA|nr:unnamed protein product [Soboliphyme baturini]
MEKCKAFRIQQEEKKELAELDAGNILTEGRLRNRNKQSSFHEQMIATSQAEEVQSDEQSSGDSHSGADCRKLFSRLQDIVDSGESD